MSREVLSLAWQKIRNMGHLVRMQDAQVNLYNEPVIIVMIIIIIIIAVTYINKKFQQHVNPSRFFLCLEVRELHSLFVYAYIFVYMLRFFAHSPIKYKQFLNRSIWQIDGTLIGTTILGQSGPESNDNEGIIHSPELEPHHQMRFSVITRIPPFAGDTFSIYLV